MEEPETNLVFFDTAGTGLTADDLAEQVRREGTMLSTRGRYRVRACTHLDVDRDGHRHGDAVIRQVSGALAIR